MKYKQTVESNGQKVTLFHNREKNLHNSPTSSFWLDQKEIKTSKYGVKREILENETHE